jgi:hypothetical protein
MKHFFLAWCELARDKVWFALQQTAVSPTARNKKADVPL